MERKRGIVIVDDEPDLVSVFSTILNKKGYPARGFTHPIDALNDFKLNHNNYALVVSDIRMPEMNGFDFVRSIKSIDGKINVILMTAFEVHKREFEKVFPTVTISEFLEKPISASRLVQVASKYAGTIQPH